MKKLLKEIITAGFGISRLTENRVNKLVRKIMKKEGISERKADKLAKNIIKKSIETEKKVRSVVMDSATKLLHSVELATKKDIKYLKKFIRKNKR